MALLDDWLQTHQKFVFRLRNNGEIVALTTLKKKYPPILSSYLFSFLAPDSQNWRLWYQMKFVIVRIAIDLHKNLIPVGLVPSSMQNGKIKRRSSSVYPLCNELLYCMYVILNSGILQKLYDRSIKHWSKQSAVAILWPFFWLCFHRNMFFQFLRLETKPLSMTSGKHFSCPIVW